MGTDHSQIWGEAEEAEVQTPEVGVKGGQELPPPGAQQQKMLPPPACNSRAALLRRLAEQASAHTACPMRPDATRPPRCHIPLLLALQPVSFLPPLPLSSAGKGFSRAGSGGVGGVR